jgi:hypothetical protein
MERQRCKTTEEGQVEVRIDGVSQICMTCGSENAKVPYDGTAQAKQGLFPTQVVPSLPSMSIKQREPPELRDLPNREAVVEIQVPKTDM